MSLGHGLLRSLRHAVGAHSGHVQPRRQGAQGLVGADVAAGLFPADVLLPGLQAQDVGPAALVVGGLTHDAAGELAHELVGGGHVAQVRAAAAQRQTQRLPLAHGDVRAAVPGGLHNGQGDGVAAHDVPGTRLVHQLAQGLGVLELAEEVGLLHIEGSNAVVQHLPQGVHIGPAVLHRHHTQLVAGAVAIGADGVDGVGVGRAGDQGHPALALPAHGRRLGGGGGPVIHGGVGHVHAGELADHGLILEDRLQKPLAHLRLIGGIGRQKLLLGGDVLDDGGNVVVIGPRAPQNGGVGAVFGGHGGHRPGGLQLAHAVGDVQRLPQQHLLRHVPVQVHDILQPHGAEHLLPLGLGGGDIAAHAQPSSVQKAS